MSSRFSEIVIDCVESVVLARWWAETLEWEVTDGAAPGERMLRMPGDDGSIPALLFLTDAGAKQGKNRIHLDLASESLDERAAIVAELVARGATRVDIGQTGVPWIVLADPEGNEFCVLEPRDVYRGIGRLAGITMDAADPRASARFWAEATGWSIAEEHDTAVTLAPPGRRVPDFALVRVDEPKTVKLRWHLDVEPIGDASVESEAQRLRDLGAVDIDIGQHDDPTTDWIVLADPAGNELCVIPPL